MNCRECNGRGWVEVPDNCGKVASMCCGGCVKDEVCFVCDGSGELDECKMDEDVLELIAVYERLLEHPFKHENIVESIYNQVNDVELYKALL